MRSLLTGFEPFGDLAFNPSELVVRELAGQGGTTDADFASDILPVDYERAGRRVEELIGDLRPDVLIGTGVSPSGAALRLERIALNLDDGDAADGSGRVRTGRPIDSSGPLALMSTCDLPRALGRLRRLGLPCAISNHAGTYLCNHVYYRMLRTVLSAGLRSKCIFVHVPMISLAERGRPPHDAASWDLKALTQAVRLVMTELIDQHESGQA